MLYCECESFSQKLDVEKFHVHNINIVLTLILCRGGFMSKDLGRALKLLRKNCELTQQQVADVLKMSRSNYAYYEGGSTEPDLKDIKKLSKIFNVPIDMLLPNSDGTVNITLNDVTSAELVEISAEDGGKVNPRSETLHELSKEERGIIAHYRALTDKQKQALMEFFENL